MDFKYYLIEQLKKHPSMQPQDVVKSCYQAAFGAEHLLADISAARRYFDAEFDSTEPCDGELFEYLSDDVARVDLGVWKGTHMPKEWLFNMFVASSSIKKAANADFEGYLACTEEVLEGNSCFPICDWQDFLEKYRALGGGAVHHSDIYRQNEKPAYRIVDRRFLSVLQVLERLQAAKKENGVKIVAIDGRAASGKTTLSGILSTVLSADVVHMDDFFLPIELRSEERMRETGGNLHYERFCEEVLPYIGEMKAFSYGVFDCGCMSIQGERLIGESDWRIVEGSYSHHPKFGEYADIKVFCTVSPEEQMKRILSRNGERMAERFKKEWIPMEERYFDAFDICRRSDMII
jgi:uridine kinase